MTNAGAKQKMARVILLIDVILEGLRPRLTLLPDREGSEAVLLTLNRIEKEVGSTHRRVHSALEKPLNRLTHKENNSMRMIWQGK